MLKPFPPGKSGNPRGRPSEKNLSFGEILRKRVLRPTTKSKLATVLIDLAIKGKSEATRLAALKAIMETLEGKPAQKPPAKSDDKLEVIFGDERRDAD